MSDKSPFYTPQAIVNALDVIQHTCANHTRCCDCPFYDATADTDERVISRCYLDNHSPNNWERNEPNAPWRAFK